MRHAGRLPGDRGDDRRMRVTHVDAGDAACEVDDAPAAVVPQQRAARLLDHEGKRDGDTARDRGATPCD